MSSILKALRKLEEEKSRSREGATDIARDILKSGPRRQSSTWLTPLCLAAAIGAAGVAGYIFWGLSEFPPLPPKAPQAFIDPPAAKAHPPAARGPLPDAVPSGPSPAPAKISPVPSAPELSAKAPSKTPAPPKPEAARKPVKTALSPPPAEKEAADPLPALVLTGIAFQEERENRLAVVNNLPVMEGTVIEGARVVEISTDRVRFDFSGRSFDVKLEEPAME